MLQNKPQTLRETNQAHRKQRIVSAARSLIADGGINAISMRKLASDVNLSVTTLYNLFGSSAGILNAVADDALDRLDEVIEAQAKHNDTLDYFLATITAGTNYIISEQAIHRPAAIARHERLSREGEQERQITDRIIKQAQQIIEQSVSRGQLLDVLDAHALAEIIFSAWERYLIRWAFQLIGEDEFRARSEYSLYVALLAVADGKMRKQILKKIEQLDSEFSKHNFWQSKRKNQRLQN